MPDRDASAKEGQWGNHGFPQSLVAFFGPGLGAAQVAEEAAGERAVDEAVSYVSAGVHDRPTAITSMPRASWITHGRLTTAYVPRPAAG